MTLQPADSQPPEPAHRVPRTINAIADALGRARRMEFDRAVGEAEAGPQLEHVLATLWGQTMLDTDPNRDRTIAAVEAGTLSTVSMAEVVRHRRAAGGAMPGAARPFLDGHHRTHE